ncbi:PTS transporter subunit EIIB [Paenibacillus macerans]|uniref:Phosphotransferase system, EIIB family protein n=1 Tax=Paenibacillus macerans TaxID=44252 RepID=A0A090XFL0_PAEMA|nr:PTS transporter subunit EIIB [Paenibacillus macerans]KFM83678.1 phosphotransferase system, EIIB family protein [Paenibacillus macerans]MCY7559612.1 PTS transporter subunit EIIB [Paenibacillus macerans]MEC0149951.1 PTS transporter subunit EIIB [Paenibacillus macerans]MEC0331139.1 PTS transporter subunit EIIB [Paenibacillus macerans]SUA86263.1 PTS system beta-glucoside-specific transporter subunit IIABC [Paenibacillus macerans]
MGKFTELSNRIVEHAGGEKNVTELYHCMTRLRYREAFACVERIKVYIRKNYHRELTNEDRQGDLPWRFFFDLTRQNL